ncbi:MAG TPA: ABC transporter ATP-binding protein [Casimicrobiaceae bacterium]|nr:ABC transporter ATP-binding protein [Casimicrobiaceae bacterium]
MSETILDIERLSVDLPRWADRPQAVIDVSLALRRNEILCVVGESGSGKSVMARAIMGLLPAPHLRASAGRVLLDGEDLLQADAARLRAIRCRRISMIFQEPMTALNPVKTLSAQIDEVLAVHTDLPRRERTDRIAAMLESVRLSDARHLMRAYPHEISGGQRQRAMIAMALILEPSVLIADEPTTALDVTTQAGILALIRDVQRSRHMGVVFITHDFGVVAEIADRVAVMQHGRLVEFGEAAQVLNAPSHPYTQALIAAIPGLAPMNRPANGSAPLVLTVRALEKTFRASGRRGGRDRVVRALKSVELTIRRGETLGVVGESGSGKSTLARCIVRLVHADNGSVVVRDVDWMRLSRRQLRAHRRYVQIVFQDPFGSLDPRCSVGRLIAEGPIVCGVPQADALARAYSLLELVGLERRAADRYPHEFSGGQRQRIGIARALALDPAILVADEPVSALDVSVQAQVLRLLADIRDRFNLAMLFITHDLRVAAQVCDRIAVMRDGEIVEHGETARVYADPQHAYTRALLAAVPGRHWQASAVRTVAAGSASAFIEHHGAP